MSMIEEEIDVNDRTRRLMLKIKVDKEGGRYQEMEERREGASVLELSMISTCNNYVSADILGRE